METWANIGADLHLELPPGAGRRAGLEQALREAVRGGRLAPGVLLPPSRSLARDLGVARNTVADVYGQLVAEGYLTARTGSGTRVAAAVVAPEPQRGPIDAAPALRFDLRPGRPDVSMFPRAAWLAATRRALAAAPDSAFDYGDPRGRPELRRALAAYLGRVRGVRADPGQVIVCTGYTQAVAVLGRALRETGRRRVAVETPGMPDPAEILRRSGLVTAPLPVDGRGARTDLLADLDCSAAVLTPAHQFPLGAALTPGRRAAAVGWARRVGGVIVEDDYDGEFRYDRQPVGALQGLDPARVVYAGTASKSLMPGLRLAWLVAPAELLEAVTEEKRLADRQSSAIDQLTLAELISSGSFDRHIRRARLHYRRRRDRLVAALAAQAPRVRVTGIAAGLHAVLGLPPTAREEAVLARAAHAGLALDGLSRYAPRDAPPALVVGYGTPAGHAFAGALDALAGLLRSR